MMKRYRNKHFYFIAIFLLMAFLSNAQSYHFIYIQSENRQQFSIKLDETSYNSSTSGYLILSKLTPGNYRLEFTFPGGQVPVQIIECIVADSDKGYYLKSNSKGGWGLYDMQKQKEVATKGTYKNEILNNVPKPEKESFGEILARVVNDPSIIQNDEAEINIKQPNSKVQEKKPAAVAIIKSEVTISAVPEKPIVADNSQFETIEQISSKLVTGGLQLAYIDKYQGVTDTIDILVPESLKKEDRNEIVMQPVQEIKIVQEVKTTSPAIVEIKVRDVEEPVAQLVKKEPKKTDSRFIDMELPNPNDSTSGIKPQIITQPKEKTTEIILAKDNQLSPVMINSDCRRTADDDDFIKLRQQMASERTDDDMITVARKKFKTTCFSTEQVKNLAVLFLKDEGKYKFFDAAYPFTSDSHNFSSLKDQLSDPYYINRFKAMIRKQ